jgi:CRP/FNR family transcriptional regulator, nitrogen fixation regulation protein
MLQSQIQVTTPYSALQTKWHPDLTTSKLPASRNPLDLLDTRGNHISVKRGRVIYTEGETADYCYKLVSGSVRTVKLLSDGRRQVCEFLMPGEHLGFGSQGEYYFTAEAVSDAELVRYSRRSVEALIREDSAVAQRLRQLASHDLQGAYERMVLMCHKSAQQRVAWFLLNMAERSGTDDDDFVLLSMTRTDIADYLGMALETVSRAIGQLKRKGVIALENVNRIIFLDRDMLEQSRGEV